MLVEYGSPNLFKSLHIGNLLGLVVGESLARLFAHAGAVVRRITYPCDIGLGVAQAVWGLQYTGGNPDSIDALSAAYRAGAEQYAVGNRTSIDAVNAALYTGDDPQIIALRDKGKATSLTHMNALCQIFGTTYDSVIYESDAAPVGAEVVRAHSTDGIFEEDAGAVIFRGERHGLHTRVFINAAGLPTYEAKDVGNFILKRKQYPQAVRSVVVTGSEQHEYFKVIHAALREIYPQEMMSMEHVSTGILTFAGKKMSSREGVVLSGEEVLAELRQEARIRTATTRADDVEELSEHIALGALKYWILRQQVGSTISFDPEQAFSFEGDSGPYLQYTHARLVSLLARAAEQGITPSTAHVPDTVYPPERLLHQFGEIAALSLTKRSPHHLAVYLTKLAGICNTWYAQEQIAAGDTAEYKLAVVSAVRQILSRGLYLLAIPAPDQM